MPTIKSVGLQGKTVKLASEFFENIKKIDEKDPSSAQMRLFSKVEAFFRAMIKLDKREFISMLEKHQFFNVDPIQQEKYDEAFACLIALIVGHYTASDLSRYFFPKEYSTELKPSSENSWRIVYWAKFLTYWLGSKLFNSRQFDLVKEDHVDISTSIRLVKKSLNENDYYSLRNQDTNFNRCLKSIIQLFIEKRDPNLAYQPASADNNKDMKTITKQVLPSPIAGVNSSGQKDKHFLDNNIDIVEVKSTPTASSLPPPPPPPPSDKKSLGSSLPLAKSPLPLVKDTSVQKKLVDSTENRDALLAQIHKGISLKKVEKPLSKAEVKADNKNLFQCLSAALNSRRTAIEEASDEDTSTTHSANSDSESAWKGDELDGAVLSPTQKTLINNLFSTSAWKGDELDGVVARHLSAEEEETINKLLLLFTMKNSLKNEAQVTAVLNLVEYKLTREFSRLTKESEIINIIRVCFGIVQLEVSNSKQDKKEAEKCFNRFFSVKNKDQKYLEAKFLSDVNDGPTFRSNH